MANIKRKRRTDRNHVLYYIEHVTTGNFYIGIAAVNFKGNVMRTLHRRMQKHVQRAFTENKSWGLCKALRTHGPDKFGYGVLDVIRGKKDAHAMETLLINLWQPKLNTFGVKKWDTL